MPDTWPVFHVPHDGDRFPEELMSSVCIPRAQFFAYHRRMRDIGVLELVPRIYRNPEHTVFFPISRLLCDVERFLGPEEVMERYGMGFCYERAYDGTVIKRVTDELKEKTLRYYRLHHAWMDQLCREHEHVLVFDLHSYSDEIVPKSLRQCGVKMPDVCIGTDLHFTPEPLAEIAEQHFQAAGFSVLRNDPYAGCFVPNAVLSGECQGSSIMLEIHKRCYCDGDGAPNPVQCKQIRRIIRQLAAEALELRRGQKRGRGY